MTPRQVKLQAVNAAFHDDSTLALAVCKMIAEQDLYLNIPKPQGGPEGCVITTRWGNRPCKGGCGTLVMEGSEAWWDPNWGVSHLECKR